MYKYWYIQLKKDSNFTHLSTYIFYKLLCLISAYVGILTLRIRGGLRMWQDLKVLACWMQCRLQV